MRNPLFRLMLVILISISLYACKPAAPISPTHMPSPRPAILTAAPSSEKPTPTFLPSPSPGVTPTAKPTPTLSIETLSEHPGWTTYPGIRSIKDMLFDQVGNLWAVGSDGVFLLKPDGSAQHYTIADGLPSNDLLSVGQGTDNSIWVGSNASGVSRFDGERWQNFDTSDGLGGNVVRDIAKYISRRGILAGTDHGLSWYDGEKWQNFSGPSFLPDDDVTSIINPRWDMIWVGTRKGVRRFETTDTYTTANGLVDDVVNSLAIGPDCSLWVSTPKGVSRYSAGTWTTFTIAGNLADNRITAGAVTLDDTAWFASPAGLSFYNGKIWTRYTQQDGLADNNVLSVIEAPDETVWIGTAGGLSHFSPTLALQSSQTSQPIQETFGSDLEFPVIYTKGGDLWTWSDGVKKQSTRYGNITGFFQSTDHNQLAVFRGGENNETSLWVMNLDGSDARLLVSQDDLDALGKFSETEESRQTNSRVSFHTTTWVPGTSMIAFGTYRRIKYDGTIFHDDLYLVDSKTGEKLTLLPPGRGGAFTYSPDGSHIAIIGQNQISIMNADGRYRRDKLMEYPTIQDVDNYYYPEPIWSPDGQYLLLALPPQQPISQEIAITTLWKIPIDGSPAIRLGSINPSFSYAFNVAFSPDQTHLAYWSMSFEQAIPKGEIHIANYDGTEDKVIQSDTTLYFVNWSPDSQHFVYYSSSNDVEVWYVRDMMGNSKPMGVTPIFVRWVSNDSFVYNKSLPCALYEMGIASINGDTQVIDRFR